jgi:hypothetical protein
MAYWRMSKSSKGNVLRTLLDLKIWIHGTSYLSCAMTSLRSMVSVTVVQARVRAL